MPPVGVYVPQMRGDAGGPQAAAEWPAARFGQCAGGRNAGPGALLIDQAAKQLGLQKARAESGFAAPQRGDQGGWWQA